MNVQEQGANAGAATASARLDLEIRNALGRVYDPCSLAANTPLSVIDMGLVRDWSIDDQRQLTVRMCVTTPTCLMGPKLIDAARHELRQITGIEQVTIEVDPSVFWTPDLMSSRGKRTVQGRHQRSRQVATVRPQQWREYPRSDRDGRARPSRRGRPS